MWQPSPNTMGPFLGASVASMTARSAEPAQSWRIFPNRRRPSSSGSQVPREKKRWYASWCRRPATPVTTSASVTAWMPAVLIQPAKTTMKFENDGAVRPGRRASARSSNVRRGSRGNVSPVGACPRTTHTPPGVTGPAAQGAKHLGDPDEQRSCLLVLLGGDEPPNAQNVELGRRLGRAPSRDLVGALLVRLRGLPRAFTNVEEDGRA